MNARVSQLERGVQKQGVKGGRILGGRKGQSIGSAQGFCTASPREPSEYKTPQYSMHRLTSQQTRKQTLI